MRYLRQQVLNRRAPADQRLYVDMTSSVIMNTTNHLLLPKGNEAARPTTMTEGMIRYNTDSHEVEVYQGASGRWRAIRFKESALITQQTSQIGDGDNTVFELTPQPDSYASTNIPVWDRTQMAKQIIVLVENVFQVSGRNYELVLGENIADGGVATPNYPYTTGTYYIQFTSAVPGIGTRVDVLHGFDQ